CPEQGTDLGRRARHWQRPALLLHQMPQVWAGNVLHREVEHSAMFSHLMELHDVRMMERTQPARLGEELFVFLAGPRHGRFDRLQRDQRGVATPQRLEDDTRPPTAERANQPVTRERLRMTADLLPAVRAYEVPYP